MSFLSPQFFLYTSSAISFWLDPGFSRFGRTLFFLDAFFIIWDRKVAKRYILRAGNCISAFTNDELLKSSSVVNLPWVFNDQLCSVAPYFTSGQFYSLPGDPPDIVDGKFIHWLCRVNPDAWLTTLSEYIYRLPWNSLQPAPALRSLPNQSVQTGLLLCFWICINGMGSWSESALITVGASNILRRVTAGLWYLVTYCIIGGFFKIDRSSNSR